ncbi:MAG: efflux RND transporter periplasmic adaptor subunit [Chloroflexota bacterium]|jgi:HlyD family secretion protein
MLEKHPLKQVSLYRLLTVLTAVFILSGCTGSTTTTNQNAEIVTAFTGDLSASATAGGQLMAQRSATLSAPVPAVVTAVSVRVGDQVAAGDLLLQLDSSDLALTVATAEQTLRLQENNLNSLLAAPPAADIAATEAAVATAQAQLDALLEGPSETELAIAEAALRTAEASLWSASSELNRTSGSISEAQILAAEAALAAAQLQLNNARSANEDNPNQQTHQALLDAEQAYASAQAQLNDLQAGPDSSGAQSSVAAAAARRDGAQADYEMQTGEASAAQIAAAQSQLAQTQASLESLIAAPSAAQLAAAEAEVTQAQLSLADAEAALAQATIRAPFDGVITAVHINPGELAGGPVIEMMDANSLTLRLHVDEQDVAALTIGQPVILTLEAWPNSEITGELIHIAPSARADAGTALVTYGVDVRLGETTLPVRAGMTANANLITAQKEGVLLVANQAIMADRASGTYTVNLVTEAGVETVPVTIGLRDGRHTEILSGLQPGDRLQVDSSAPMMTFGPPE